MKLENKTIYWQVDHAIDLFNHKVRPILNQIDDLPESKYFTYTEDTSKVVVKKIRAFLDSDRVVQIKAYKSWPFSKVIGYTKNGEYFINSRKIYKLTISELAGNIFHEVCHLIGYKHGSNFPSNKKQKSVPYFLGYNICGKNKIEDLILP